MENSAPVALDTIPEALADIAAGRMVIVVDDEDRENEGDLIMAASHVTPEALSIMIRHGSGIVCAPMQGEQLKRLGLGPMVQQNREQHRTDFTVSVDAARGITTGISAADRARTIRLLADPTTPPEALVQPGHVFPLRARPGGVLERAGHTEAAVDLARLAGLPPAGVICEIMNDDGTVARLPELQAFRQRFGLKLISIAALIEYRHRRECLVEEVHREGLTNEWGEWTLRVFRSLVDGRHHFALCRGELGGEPTLVRVQSEYILSDTFRGRGVRGEGSLEAAFSRVAAEGRGVVLYMTQPDSGVRLTRRAGEAAPLDVMPMDFRGYGIGAQVLAALGLQRIRLLTGSSRHIVGLDGYGLEIVERLPLAS